jgi:hypothetical protein
MDEINDALSVEASVLDCELGHGMPKFKIGSACALLLYCQGAVTRDGSVAFLVIEAVASDIAPHFLNITKVKNVCGVTCFPFAKAVTPALGWTRQALRNDALGVFVSQSKTMHERVQCMCFSRVGRV